ncbi:MAG: hypothetical protein HPY61_04195 [Methanotrichaceae archaeon]|nr:hypothetical protein [Methanotrichaceae archaeon]
MKGQVFLTILFLLTVLNNVQGHDLEFYRHALWSDSYRDRQDVSGPGIIVGNLTICQDQEFLERLADLLKHYKFEKTFENDVFDCSDMSAITWNILVNRGYDARIMLGDTGSDFHAWVMVRDGSAWTAVETVHNPQNEVGRVAEPDNVWIQDYPQYFCGWMFNSSEEMKIFTDDTVAVRSDTPMSLLPVRALN